MSSNLDRLAAQGLRFAQFYNAARCCPTRAALLTGLYSHQAIVGHMTFDRGLPGYRGTLTEHTVTIAEVLRAADYHTAMAGNWHLSSTRDGPQNAAWVSHRLDLGPFCDPRTYPTARGFEQFYGTIWGVVDHYDPFSLVEGDRPVPALPAGFYDAELAPAGLHPARRLVQDLPGVRPRRQAAEPDTGRGPLALAGHQEQVVARLEHAELDVVGPRHLETLTSEAGSARIRQQSGGRRLRSAPR
jgi:arylsulfatase A-like enzyme